MIVMVKHIKGQGFFLPLFFLYQVNKEWKRLKNRDRDGTCDKQLGFASF